ncbi:MAG: 16S rRNA (cytidine(1402)-2'-O)-methyltransferase [Deltaproteobacteria bacterium]|jgi:16S rRNA (cytidine1402-2'-O)-methyltransferase|nr:16S rRNA (cytidine(1402)-2'-O)-methyltransferase [Deltaproteobacteria bacterium]
MTEEDGAPAAKPGLLSELLAFDGAFESALYLLPTPLGNLGDMTFRGVSLLRKSDLILAEDTRRTSRLLNCLEARGPLASYREQNHDRVFPRVVSELERKGVVTLVTDAGAPLISDPGTRLVAAAREKGFKIIPFPGASAVITALMAAGLPAGEFIFGGYLPPKPAARLKYAQTFKNAPLTLVFFETPHRLVESLSDLLEAFGPREALMAREMTKIHEEYLYATLDYLLKDATRNPRVGEVTIVIAGNRERADSPKKGLALFDERLEWATLAEAEVEERLAPFRAEILASPQYLSDLASAWREKTGVKRKILYAIFARWRKEDA